MALRLELFPPPAYQLNWSMGAILKKSRQNVDLQIAKKSSGIVNSGILQVTQISGGISSAVSNAIVFNCAYSTMPIFTWGLDGTPQISTTDGSNKYHSIMSQETIDAITANTYQPAIFIPRVLQWVILDYYYLGCYLLVTQINADCTETDKSLRLHYRFEGRGIT